MPPNTDHVRFASPAMNPSITLGGVSLSHYNLANIFSGDIEKIIDQNIGCQCLAPYMEGQRRLRGR